jgi:general secretion pathway protein M
MARKLTRRERYVVIAAASLVTLVIIHQLVLSPAMEAHKRLEKTLIRAIEDSKDIAALSAEYLQLKNQASLSRLRIKGRRPGFTLFSFLDQQAGETAMKDRIVYMKPSTSGSSDGSYKIAQVEMKFQDITMEQLTTYLYRVETSENQIFIKRLSISKDSKSPGFINAIMQVQTSET